MARIIRLFTPQALSIATEVALDGAAANHLSRVLRARVGDIVTLFNGDGRDFLGTVVSIDKRAVRVGITDMQTPNTESSLATHLGLCVSKGERFDWAVQKATELGVHAITPLQSERIDVKLPPDRLEKKRGHWQQIAASACEQCGRAVVPPVHPIAQLGDWLANRDEHTRIVLSHRDEGVLSGERPDAIALLVGPEGGLSEREVHAAVEAGFQTLCLGPRVLRTETAPVVALTALGLRWGDLQR